MTRIAWIAGALQAAFLLAWAGQQEQIRATAPTFRIPLRPVDPFDVVRGRYFNLNPEDATVEVGPGTKISGDELHRLTGTQMYFYGEALVGLCPAGDVYRVCALRPLEEPSLPPEPRWVRASTTVQSNGLDKWTLGIYFGLDRYFLPNAAQLPAAENAPGWQLEVLYRPRQALLARQLWFKDTRVP
jgi:hypothetical protein